MKVKTEPSKMKTQKMTNTKDLLNKGNTKVKENKELKVIMVKLREKNNRSTIKVTLKVRMEKEARKRRKRLMTIS